MQNIYFCDMTLFQMFYIFFFWSLFGWGLEVIVRTLETGGFENRGFLNGPFCPIYGFGVLMIIVSLTPIKDMLLTLYFTSSILCSTLELFVGLLLQGLFRAKWWDYSNEKFNFKGFICLKISLMWGLGCVLMLRIVHPIILRGIKYIPYKFGNVIIILALILIFYDLVCSVLEVCNLNSKLQQLDKLSRIMHDKSIALGENISDEVLDVKAKYDRISEQIKEKQSCIIKAFPHMTSDAYNETLKSIKKKLNIK